jgi:hypothetical protein
VDIVGGYRLVRLLGSGERAEVYLGHAGSADATAASTAAIKVFRGGASERSIGEEIGVLARTASPHLLRLCDVATAPDGRPCAILPRLSSMSLARLLADRSSLGAGEAITILAPLGAAVAGLHRERAVHGAIRPGTVLFDGRGAPVLACFGRAAGFGAAGGFGTAGATAPATVAELADEPRVAEDLEALAALAELVLGRVTGGAADGRVSALRDWLGATDPGANAGRFAEELSGRLFELAPAAPVDFTRPIAPGPGMVPGRVIASTPGAMPQQHADPPQQAAATVSHGRLAGIAVGLLRNAAAQLPIGAARLERVRGVVASVRKPFWIAGLAGAAAIVVALSLMPLSGGADAAAGAAASPAAASTSAASRSASPREAAGTSGDGAGVKGAVGGDDPAAAVAALLRSRKRCILKRSVLCLDGVDQPNSSALEDDRYLIRSLAGGGTVGAGQSFAGAEATLSERLGDSALVTLQGGDPPVPEGAALLIVKGPSGWRIRDILGN